VDNYSTWGRAAIDASCSFMAANRVCWSALAFIILQLCLSTLMSSEPYTPFLAAWMIHRTAIVGRCSVPVFKDPAGKNTASRRGFAVGSFRGLKSLCVMFQLG
jgi:hypothetical protein